MDEGRDEITYRSDVFATLFIKLLLLLINRRRDGMWSVRSRAASHDGRAWGEKAAVDELIRVHQHPHTNTRRPVQIPDMGQAHGGDRNRNPSKSYRDNNADTTRMARVLISAAQCKQRAFATAAFAWWNVHSSACKWSGREAACVDVNPGGTGFRLKSTALLPAQWCSGTQDMHGGSGSGLT